jgi:hypothetical protein
MFVIEDGIISDIALVSLFVVFILRSAILETPVESASGYFERYK